MKKLCDILQDARRFISFTQMIDTNKVGAGLAKSLEYPVIRLKSKPALSQAFVANI